MFSSIPPRSLSVCLFVSSSTEMIHGSRSEGTDPLAILLEARFEPCQVCGEQSSGLHCGAITCEACKVNDRKVRLSLTGRSGGDSRNSFYDRSTAKIRSINV